MNGKFLCSRHFETLSVHRLVLPVVFAVATICLQTSAMHGAEKQQDGLVLSASDFYAQAVKDSEGRKWQSLFNGRNLDGWKVVLQSKVPVEDPESIFQVIDGEIHVYRDAPAGKRMPYGFILSNKVYSDYRFRFEFKWGSKKFAPRENAARDAGLLFHVIGPEKVWPMSVECQVIEGGVGDCIFVETSGKVFVNQKQGEAQYDPTSQTLTEFYRPNRVIRVATSKTVEHDGWNRVEVIVRGNAAVYLVNGEINNYAVQIKAPVGKDGSLAPLTAGRLALQGEGAEVFYRNIQLMPLPEMNPPGFSTSFVPADESHAPIAALTPDRSRDAWNVRPGFRVELMAAEPLLMDPVAIDWGLDGKLWVAEMADYPLGLNEEGQPGGRIRYLEDFDNDGRYDSSTLFLEGLNFPTGIVSWGNGVIVTAAPEIFYAEDTNGDGKCDVRKVLFSGFQEGNQQLRINGLRWGLDGWLYCASGSHTPRYGKDSRIRSHLTGEDIALGSRDFRFNPATGELDPLSGPSQFGRNRDDVGNWFGVQNSYPIWHYVLEDRYLSRNPHVAASTAKQLLCGPNPRLFPVAVTGAGPTSQAHVGRFTSACSGMVYRDQLLPLQKDVSHAFTCDPVHNLIQHNLLTRSGATFTMQRDAEGETPDFLASADPWCRPVMVRTGPDGALWVVDMYRYIIEHPQWVSGPAKDEMLKFIRLGDGRGRIYRLLPEGQPAREVPDLLNASSENLVEYLEHPNGWVRDAAQRQLTARNDRSTIKPLQRLLRGSGTVPARLHAAWSLQALQACGTDEVLAMLNDPSEDVRRTGLIFAEAIQPLPPALLTRITELVNDSSPVVRLQLACSLGEWDDPAIDSALAQLWRSADPEDAFLQTALLSSLNSQNIAAVVESAADAKLETVADRKQFRELAQQALAFEHFDPVRSVLARKERSPEEVARAIMLLDVIQQQPANSPAASLADAETVSHLCREGKELLDQEDQPEWIRSVCLLSLFRDPKTDSEDQALAEDLLTRNLPTGIISNLVGYLGRQADAKSAQILLSGWSGYLPTTRHQVLEAWVAHPGWYPLLVQAIDDKKILPGEISLSLQQEMVANSPPKIANELKARFQSEMQTPQDLQKVASDVLGRNGDTARGRVVFQKHCVDCHQFRGEGQLVGPNLSAVTSRTPQNLIEAILSPNKAIEPKYINYAVMLVDGRVLSGLIESDAGNSLTLLKAKGERTSVLRRDIEQLRSTGKSLMPEGFEKTIPPQDLADLIAYLQLGGALSGK